MSMYAIVDLCGVQYQVSESQTVRIPKIVEEPGKTVDFGKVLLVADKEQVSIGKPTVKNAKVQATVLKHGKDDKILVFKKKSKKGYQKLRGHRQEFTEIRVDKIVV